MLRARINFIVRGRPNTVSGTSAAGKPYAFDTVEVLDEDYNKCEATLGDDVDKYLFQEGVKVDALCEITVYGGRLRCKILDAKELTRSAAPPASAGAAAPASKVA